MKKALITGITGQDGSYLAELLLLKGYEVHGIIRRASSINTERLNHLYEKPGADKDRRLKLYYGDITDGSRLTNLIRDIRPAEVYNLGAQSHVRVSFDEPLHTADTTALGTLRLLEAIRLSGVETRFYQASSSEMFGQEPAPQNEKTPLNPRSPYGVSKLFAHQITKNYREAYGMFAVSGILFNHESPRRGETFVTRKIARGIAAISERRESVLELGNLSAVRDWGYAPEYVIGIWKMLQTENPEDLVLGTGNKSSVADFLNVCAAVAGVDANKHVRINPRFYRPTEVDFLLADPQQAKHILKWNPSIYATSLAEVMTEHELRAKGHFLLDKPTGELWGDETGE